MKESDLLMLTVNNVDYNDRTKAFEKAMAIYVKGAVSGSRRNIYTLSPTREQRAGVSERSVVVDPYGVPRSRRLSNAPLWRFDNDLLLRHPPQFSPATRSLTLSASADGVRDVTTPRHAAEARDGVIEERRGDLAEDALADPLVGAGGDAVCREFEAVGVERPAEEEIRSLKPEARRKGNH